MSNAVILPVGTLSYPHLHKPDDKFGADSAKYKCQIIFDKGTDLSELEALIKEQKGKKKTDMDELIKIDEDGRLVINPRSKFKIGCYDAKKNKLAQDEIEDVFYGGCKVKAKVAAYGHAFGVSIAINDILFVGDGERLGGGGNPFGESEDSEDAFPE